MKLKILRGYIVTLFGIAMVALDELVAGIFLIIYSHILLLEVMFNDNK